MERLFFTPTTWLSLALLLMTMTDLIFNLTLIESLIGVQTWDFSSTRNRLASPLPLGDSLSPIATFLTVVFSHKKTSSNTWESSSPVILVGNDTLRMWRNEFEGYSTILVDFSSLHLSTFVY